MEDSYGDGWNNVYWTWTEVVGSYSYSYYSDDGGGDSGTLENGASGTAPLCGDDCYALSVGGGAFSSEISWTITRDDTGEEEASGGAEDSATVCSAAQPSPLPTTSQSPTTTASPTLPTYGPTAASNYGYGDDDGGGES